MGGRGKSSGANANQRTLDRISFAQEIERIKQRSDDLRNIGTSNSIGIGAGGGGVSVTQNIQCACCEVWFMPQESRDMICPVCGWIYDSYQQANPDSREGRNPISLNEARKQHQNL